MAPFDDVSSFHVHRIILSDRKIPWQRNLI